MRIVADVPGERLDLQWGVGRFFSASGNGFLILTAVLTLFYPIWTLLLWGLRPTSLLFLVPMSLGIGVCLLWPRPYSLEVGGRAGQVRYWEAGAFGAFGRGWAIALDALSGGEAVIAVNPIGSGYEGRGRTELRITLRERNKGSRVMNLGVEFVDKAQEGTDFVFRFAAAAQFKYRRVVANSSLADGGTSPGGGRVVKVELLQAAAGGAVPVVRPGRKANYRNVFTAEAADPVVVASLASEIIPPFETGLWPGGEIIAVWDPGVRVVVKSAASGLVLDWTRYQATIEGGGRIHTLPLQAVRAVELRRWMNFPRKGEPSYHSAVEAHLCLSGSEATTATSLLSSLDCQLLENRIGLEAHQQFEAFAVELARALGVPVRRSFGRKAEDLTLYGVPLDIPNYRVLE